MFRCNRQYMFVRKVRLRQTKREFAYYGVVGILRDYIFSVIDINTAGTAGIYAVGEDASTLMETLMQACSVKTEAPNFRWG